MSYIIQSDARRVNDAIHSMALQLQQHQQPLMLVRRCLSHDAQLRRHIDATAADDDDNGRRNHSVSGAVGDPSS